MKIGPKYKIARRLGAPVFEKTQTQKFVLSQARKEKAGIVYSRSKSDYGAQLSEKQKARYTYCLTEKQFSRYAKTALAKKDARAAARLFESLELRADNVAYRAGFAPTRLAARQLVSHGHLTVNGKRINAPSHQLTPRDVLSIRVGSEKKPLFADLSERLKIYTVPSWIVLDKEEKKATIQAKPTYEAAGLLFDLRAILEFYSR
ncbi:30S ribosomal protein S4 [Patescibacteria group bacterium]|nr:MAG: 30S ribosomal protein S4 [Patescibacteria group bacterium]